MVFTLFVLIILKKYNILLDFTKFAAMAVVCGNVMMILTIIR
jgi:hypothetical protein